MDVHSHISIDSHACLNVSHPKAQEYQRLLRRAFIRYGLPLGFFIGAVFALVSFSIRDMGMFVVWLNGNSNLTYSIRIDII